MSRPFKHKVGRYTYYRAYVTLPDGKRKSIQAPTRREAEELVAKEEQNIKAGLTPDAEKETLKDFLKRYLDYIKPHEHNEYGVSPSVHQDYRYLCEKHIIPALGAKRVRDLTIRDVDDLLRRKADSGLSMSTVQYIHRVLRRALNFAVDWYVIERNPASARMRTAKRRKPSSSKPDKIHCFTPEQSDQFLEIVRGDKHEALFVLALTTGARPGELMALQWRDVQFVEKKVTIQRALHRTKRKSGEDGKTWMLREPKTAGSRRTLSIPTIAVTALEKHRADQRTLKKFVGDKWVEMNFVFTSDVGTPLDISNVLHHFQRICAVAGLPKLRFYDLRHTHASLLIAKGKHPKVIASRLGHASIKLTMDTYGHLFDNGDREAADAMDSLFGEPENLEAPNVQRELGRPPDTSSEEGLRKFLVQRPGGIPQPDTTLPHKPGRFCTKFCTKSTL